MINNLYAEKIQSDAGMQGLACLDLILLARWLGTTPFEPSGWRRADGAASTGAWSAGADETDRWSGVHETMVGLAERRLQNWAVAFNYLSKSRFDGGDGRESSSNHEIRKLILSPINCPPPRFFENRALAWQLAESKP
jgi:hypothetical protein